MYKTESILGLIGSILGIVAVVLILIVSLLIGFLFNTLGNAVNDLSNTLEAEGWEVTDNAANVVSGAVTGTIAFVIIGLILAIAAVVLGFIGYGKLKKDNKQGGIFLIIAGVLALASLFLGGIFGVVSVVLFLVGGIMALAKKPAAA